MTQGTMILVNRHPSIPEEGLKEVVEVRVVSSYGGRPQRKIYIATGYS